MIRTLAESLFISAIELNSLFQPNSWPLSQIRTHKP
jgi:hypothetical protein